MSRFFLVLVLLISAAQATMVVPELHECPVCGEKSVTQSLASYSMFGEPARDFSDQPSFAFARADVCPNDLFASWPDSWGKIEPADKAKLADFLKQPALNLTDQEKAIIGGHEKEFREGRWFLPLWARTCDSYRTLNDRDKFDRILRLHYAGGYFDPSRPPKDFEQRLIVHYREDAITALKDVQLADWPKPDEKRVFAYLHAELTRQAGRDAEAVELFQKVIATESSQKPDEETSWILQWATEQILRAGPEAKDVDLLVAAIIPEMPDPWRKKSIYEDPRWPRHYAAIDVLADHAASGNKPFSDALWKLLDRKPERLLALLETTGRGISSLRDIDPRWREWFDEIAALLNKGELPTVLSKDSNHTRVHNVLIREVEAADDNPSPWLKEVFLPEVRKRASDGGIPKILISNKQLFPGLSLPSLDGEEKPKAPASPTYNEISRALYELWEQLPPGERSDLVRIYVRILKKLDDEYESFDYPVTYFLPQIAETEEGRAAIHKEFDGTWKSSFWKAACAYAADMKNSRDDFVRHPVTAKADDSLIVKLLLQKSDPSWKDIAIKKLFEAEYLSSEVITYLVHLDLPETRKALDEFAKKVRNENGKKENGRLYTLENLDSTRISEGMQKLPIR